MPSVPFGSRSVRADAEGLSGDRTFWLLSLPLAVALVRLWLMPLPSSFWVDEMGTAFVVHFGGYHPSFVAAPQVPQSIYYYLPEAAEVLFGFSETVYRVPSVLMMGIALWLVARLAARLIRPEAAWFAVFACLALRGISYEADDARPYALGIAVAAAALLFLVRWMDTGRIREAALFVFFATTLWRVHLIYWPFYPAVAVYVLVRLWRRDSAVGLPHVLFVFSAVGVALVPVGLKAMALLHQAGDHVIAEPPSARALFNALKPGLVLGVGAAAWLVGRWRRQPRNVMEPASVFLMMGWWLAPPLSLFVFSRLTGNSVFVARYYSLCLPGIGLSATVLAARYLPKDYWKQAALLLGAVALLMNGQWQTVWPPHQNSDWRGAARTIREIARDEATPVICPSPFVEARPPIWRPDYRLPGFLYSHLAAYPISGRVILFPFELTAEQWSPEVDSYAGQVTREVIAPAGKFVLYGGAGQVKYWSDWFGKRPELSGWQTRRVGDFGDVTVIYGERR